MQPVNTDLVPSYADIFEDLKMQKFNSVNGVAYGIPHGRGANLIMWNTDKVTEPIDSWAPTFEADSPYAGAVTAYDSPIFIADAAVYLMATKPELGIKDPYALDKDQFQAAVATNPDDDNARFDYIKALMLAGRSDDAKVAFAPVIAKAAGVRRLDSLQRWMDASDFADSQPPKTIAAFDTQIAANKRDFQARFDKARLLMAQQQWTAAMDELLEILMRDKAWDEDRARKTFIAILDVIEQPKPKVAEGHIPPDDPVVATYRRRLSSVVLS